ncbi:hypothetical protein [Candidatus Palauibacter sp.]|uniref:hypothetical protein n=1 Tax=Candidatus Palauibacter sp. TaxID=3101350 RepID=UPI003B0166C8
MWNPEVFFQAAEIHRSAGSDRRAAELLALSVADPVTPLEAPLAADGQRATLVISDEQLAAARTTMYERVTAALLDEHVNLDARLRAATGEETTLRETVRGRIVLVVQALRPDFVRDEALSLLDVNSERLHAAGVRTLLIAQQPAPAILERSGFDSRFHQDVGDQAWAGLRAWREVQYFVLDRSGKLRHRGEDPEAALRISFVLSM